MKSAELIKELIAAGCKLKRHNGGSHQIWWSPITGKTFPVPIQRKICRQEPLAQLKDWQASTPCK